MILGIDEVGRGPWAGPLVVGAVVLGGAVIDGLTDSKKLSKKRRDELDKVIRQQSSGIGLGWVSAKEIDDIGLSKALSLATRRAVEQVKTAYNEIIIDGTINFLKDTNKELYVTTIKKADLLIPAVSAASIVAKVARDKYMEDQDELYPGYGFKSHVGYGTAAHIEAINRLGVTPLHRLSFAPLVKYRQKTTIQQKSTFRGPSSEIISSKQIGDDGEDVAARYLVRLGHKILDRNWKTKFCEIDIISIMDNTLYFTEVKYRKSSQQGGGIAAITPKKLRQMKFAVGLYTHSNKITDIELRLMAVSVVGKLPVVDEILEIF